MKRSLIVLTIVAAASVAYSFQQLAWYGPFNYRPADLVGTRPGPGVFPMTVEVAFDFDGAPAGARDELSEALSVWTALPASPWTFTFADSGDEACSPMFMCQNDVNNVVWVTSNWPSYFGHDAIAITSFESVSGSGAVNETDTYFNDQDFNFSIGDTPVSGQYDLKSVAVHELGHMVCLDDLYDFHFQQSTMYGYGEPADLKARTLDADDEDGIAFIYPHTEADYPNPGITGIAIGAATPKSTISLSQGLSYDNVTVKGYGFVYTQALPSATIEAEIYQAGLPVASPLALNLLFTDNTTLGLTLDLTASPSVGQYDLQITNPNGKVAILRGGVQSNLPGNVQPTIAVATMAQAYKGQSFTTCADATDPVGDGDGDVPLVYKWTLVVQPDGASTTLQNTNQECVSFTPPALGWYALDVSVSDGLVWSALDGIEIIADTYSPPVVPVVDDGDDGGGGGGCAMASSGNSASVLPLMLIILAWYLARNRRRGRIN